MGAARSAPKGSERFRKSLRLRFRHEFLRVQDRGVRVLADPLLALALKNSLGVTRLGITISSKVGNAVVRNRIRRWLRELFRKRRTSLPAGVDLVLIATPRAQSADSHVLERAYVAMVESLRRRFP